MFTWYLFFRELRFSVYREYTASAQSIILKKLWRAVRVAEAVVQRCSVKKVFLEISQNSQENTCPRVSFLIKLQASGLRPETRDSGTGVFL